MLTQLRASLEPYFATQWGNRTPIAWDNAPFNETDKPEWVRHSIQLGAARETSISSRRREAVQMDVTIGVFGPENRGTKRLFELAEEAAGYYRGIILTPINEGDVPFDAEANIENGTVLQRVPTRAVARFGSPEAVLGGLHDSMFLVNVHCPAEIEVHWYRRTVRRQVVVVEIADGADQAPFEWPEEFRWTPTVTSMVVTAPAGQPARTAGLAGPATVDGGTILLAEGPTPVAGYECTIVGEIL